MVDIAIRALSPAVNDPTTAVQVLDHLEDVLREIGTTHLVSNEERTGPRHHGVVVPVRRWDDYLTLGVTEIREYGGNSVQVMRRLRAMLEHLPPGSAFSGLTAAWLHGIDVGPGDPIEAIAQQDSGVSARSGIRLRPR